VHVHADMSSVNSEGLAGMEPDAGLEGHTIGPGMVQDAVLDRDRRCQGIPRPGKVAKSESP
jgi:hypothetical protein